MENLIYHIVMFVFCGTLVGIGVYSSSTANRNIQPYWRRFYFLGGIVTITIGVLIAFMLILRM